MRRRLRRNSSARLPGSMSQEGGRSREERSRQVKSVLLITLVLNGVVAAAKIATGISFNLTSVMADGFHSLVDMVSNLIALTGLAVADKPGDEDHPYGHGKFETLAAIGISFLIFQTCFEIVESAVQRFLGSESAPHFHWSAVAVTLATIGVNLGVTLYESRKGRILRSEILLADARHTRSDLFVSVSVLATLAAISRGFAAADILCSLIIGGFILRAGFDIIRDTIDTLVDAYRLAPEAVSRVAGAVSGVSRVKDIRTRGRQDQIFLDLTIEVDGEMTVSAGHEITDQVEKKLIDTFDDLTDVVVHLEPGGQQQS